MNHYQWKIPVARQLTYSVKLIVSFNIIWIKLEWQSYLICIWYNIVADQSIDCPHATDYHEYYYLMLMEGKTLSNNFIVSSL